MTVIEVSQRVDLATVLNGFCSVSVYDKIKAMEPVTLDISVAINRDGEIDDVVPGPDGCTTALYLGMLPTIAPSLKAGEYQEIVQALRDHEHSWHADELPMLAMDVLRGRTESWNEREAV